MKNALFKSVRRKGNATRWHAWGYPDAGLVDALVSDAILIVLLMLALTGHLSVLDAFVGVLSVIKKLINR